MFFHDLDLFGEFKNRLENLPLSLRIPQLGNAGVHACDARGKLVTFGAQLRNGGGGVHAMRCARGSLRRQR